MQREEAVGIVAEGTVFENEKWRNVSEAEFQRCIFVGADFSESLIGGSRFVDCRFERCDLSLWKPVDSVWGGCLFEDCRMLGIDWTLAIWPRVPLHDANVFTRCDLSMGTFANVSLGPVKFDECRLREVSFRRAQLAGASLENSDCFGADLYGADLTGAHLVGVTDLTVDPRTTQLEGSTVDAITGMAILTSLGIDLEATGADGGEVH